VEDKNFDKRGESSYWYRYKAVGIMMFIMATFFMKASGDCKCPKEWTIDYPSQRFCGHELIGSSCHSETYYNCTISNEIPIPLWNCTTQAQRKHPYCFVPLPVDCMDVLKNNIVSKSCMLSRSCVGKKRSRRFKN
jgi:hypothetical protein